jgi:Ca2+-binding RTX toxin-like protein
LDGPADAIAAGDGLECVGAGAVDDRLRGGTGADHPAGGEGAVTFVIENRLGAESSFGEAGIDTIDLSALTRPATVISP